MWQIRLARQYARRNPVQTLLLAVSIAVTLSIPVASRLIVDRFEQRMTRQADAVPVVVGPRGSRFDLVLASVFYRSPPDRTVSMAVVDELGTVPGVDAVPLSTRFTARGRRLVCAGYDLFDRLGLRAAEGTLPLLVGDATLGSAAAQSLGLGVGDTISSDRHELFDLSVPPPITMTVSGILERTGTSADEAVFASIETAWLIGGQSHTHENAQDLEADDLIAASDRAITVKPTLETETRITESNVLTIHGHHARDQLPLTAVLMFANEAKPLTIGAARFEGHESIQAVLPGEVIDEMMDTVVRVQVVFDAIVGVLATATVLLVLLTTSLAARLRRREFAILESVGAPRLFRPTLLLLQLAFVSVVALMLTTALVWGADQVLRRVLTL